MNITLCSNNIIRDEWPRSSRHCCFWCSHRFGHIPVLVPVWSGHQFHLHGNYCSWNCAKSHTLEKAKAGHFPLDLTSIGLFAFAITIRGRHCQDEKPCTCGSRFTGVVPAPPKETLQDYGGHQSVAEFRRGFLTIDSYTWLERFFDPGRPALVPRGVDRSYLFTTKPLRRVKVLDVEEDEDPIVLIKRRVY